MLIMQVRSGLALCLSVRMFQHENRCKDLDSVRYLGYDNEQYAKTVPFIFLHAVIKMANERTCEVRSTLAPLAVVSYSDV